MMIAQLSDTHITPRGELLFERVDTAACLVRAVEHVLAMRPPPDAVLATGDLVDGGTPDEYARLRELLSPLPMPVYLVAGNHDDRDALRAAFPDHRYLPRDGLLQYVIESYTIRIIVLHTLVPGQAGGEISGERLEWLDARLAESSRPAMIVMHHAPFRTGIARMDVHGLANAAAMGDVVSRYRHVERIVCGHLHRPIQARWGGTVALTAPSTAHQVALDLDPDVPKTRMVMEPPACLVHLWRQDTGLVTHTSYIGEFAAAR